MNPFILPALAVALLAPAPALSPAPSPLSTVAERSQWQRTGRYDEVVQLCHAFAARYHAVSCERFGTSPEGRPLLALTLGKKGAPTVVMQGGIHAGEIDGKDAGFLVLRELLEGRLLDPATLARIRVVFVPVFNVDGHERFGAHNRPNQVGPAESGWRTTAQNLNLNRDYMKAQAPEMRAMLQLLQREDPLLYVDLHVTDGANFQHDVAVLVTPEAADAPPELAQAAAALRAQLQTQLTAQKHLPLVDFYPSFVRQDDPIGGFAMEIMTPRYSNSYWGQRNRMGVLVETHSWKDYATRVRATHDVLAILLRELAAHGAQWRQAARAADAIALGGKPLTVAWAVDDKRSRPIDFLGYHYERSKSDVSGMTRIRYDDQRPEVWHIPFFDQHVAQTTVELPRDGWVIPAAFAPIVAPVLQAQGIVTEPIDPARWGDTVEVDVLHALPSDKPPRLFEGRPLTTVRGTWKHEQRPLRPGSLFVPIDPARQPHARIAAQLLEPEAPDSLASWGFFAAVFERKEYMEDYVLEDVAATMLRDPAVKAEFDARLRDDPAFAGHPQARLDFFYRRHPSFDAEVGVIPVYRLQRRPH